MDPVTLYAPDGREVVVRSAVEATNLRASGYRDDPPEAITLGTPGVEPAVTFDPAEHTVEEVKEFLLAHPELADGVLAAESAGRNRAGITGGAS